MPDFGSSSSHQLFTLKGTSLEWVVLLQLLRGCVIFSVILHSSRLLLRVPHLPGLWVLSVLPACLGAACSSTAAQPVAAGVRQQWGAAMPPMGFQMHRTIGSPMLFIYLFSANKHLTEAYGQQWATAPPWSLTWELAGLLDTIMHRRKEGRKGK